MINKKLNKKAWKIRKKAAKKFKCKVKDVRWKDCLQIAVKKFMKRLIQRAIQFKHTPAFETTKSSNLVAIANLFDRTCNAMGIKKQCIRY